MRTRARFITFEGGEGTGKSTQARRLAERLTAAGLQVVTTREPGGSAFAEHVRTLVMSQAAAPRSPLAEALLFNAARSDHLDITIRPALESGKWVVCDRFADSTRVYQGLAGGLRLSIVDDLERMVVGDTMTDLTFLLDLDPRVGLARVTQRRSAGTGGASDAYESRQLAFHDRLRAGFLEVARANPQRIVVCDASLAPDAIAETIWREIAARFGLGAA